MSKVEEGRERVNRVAVPTPHIKDAAPVERPDHPMTETEGRLYKQFREAEAEKVKAEHEVERLKGYFESAIEEINELRERIKELEDKQ